MRDLTLLLCLRAASHTSPADKPATYWKANAKLVMQVGKEEAKSNLHRHTPVRILRPGQPPIQEPIAPLDAAGACLCGRL